MQPAVAAVLAGAVAAKRLARWSGVAEGELAGVLPNLPRFGGAGYPGNLGFMG